MPKTPETLTHDECTKLLGSFILDLDTPSYRALEIRNYAMTILMLDAGLRVGEVVYLLINDLWYQNQPVNNLLIRSEITKGRNERAIPLSGRIQGSATLMNLNWWKNLDKAGTDYAFFNPRTHKHISTRQVERIIAYVSLRSIGRRIHPHVLRHTFASRLMRKCNARIVQELLGHKSLQSTQIYTHPNSDDLKDAIDSLNSNDEGEK